MLCAKMHGHGRRKSDQGEVVVPTDGVIRQSQPELRPTGPASAVEVRRHLRELDARLTPPPASAARLGQPLRLEKFGDHEREFD